MRVVPRGYYTSSLHGGEVYLFCPRGGVVTVKRGYLLLSVLLMSLLIGGCGARQPTAVELAGEGTLLAQAEVQGGLAVLAKEPAGRVVITVWKEGTVKGTFWGEGGLKGPLIGMTEGVAVVGGTFPDTRAAQVELFTPETKVLKGKMQNGAYLFAWQAKAAPDKLVIRILDEKGIELYRWPPALPAAGTTRKEDVS